MTILMHKPHSTSATVHFLQAIKNGISYTDEGHYIQFDGNSITIRPLLSSDPPFGSIDYLISLFKAPLRKYKANHSSRLQLYLHECPDLDKGLLHQIGSEIATNFKHLRELTIQFFLCDNLTAEGLRYFLTPIAKNVKGLKKLSLSINCCAKFNDKGIYAIRSLLLRRLTGLKKLTLNLCPELVTVEDGECVQTSFDSNLLDRLNRFPHYSINQQIHAPIQITSKGVQLLSKSVGQYLNQKLQKLVLTLPHPNNYNPVQNLRSNKKAIQNLKKLEVLHLNFCTSYVEEETIQGTSKQSNEEIASIAHCIGQNMINLQYLSLDFSFLLSITNQTLMKIASSIFPNLPHLRGFAIFCQYDVPISDSGIISFVSNLAKHAKKLEDLDFCFNYIGGLSNKWMHEIVYHIVPSLPCLKRLIFDIDSPHFEEDEILLDSPIKLPNIEQLTVQLSTQKIGTKIQLPKLKKLTLLFGFCHSMTDSIFAELVHNLFSWDLSNLEELTISFIYAGKVTDFRLRALWLENWGKFPKLKSLTFELYRNSHLTDAMLQVAANCLKRHLSNLNSLSLIFRACDLITMHGIKDLTKNIAENLGNLEGLCLDFFQFELDNDQGDDLFDTMAQYISQGLKALRRLKLYLGVSGKYDDPVEEICMALENLSESRFLQMSKPHPTPIAFSFLKHYARYINDTHYIQFDRNSVIIKPILNRNQQTGNINDLLGLFKSILKKYRDKHLDKLHLYVSGCHGLDKVTLCKLGLEIKRHFKNSREFALQFFMCDNLTDEMIEGLLFPISKNIKNLRKLNISLNSCAILDENSIKLVRSLLLKNIYCTEKLTLNFTPMRFKLPKELVPFDSNLDTIKLTKENMTAHPVCNIPLQEISLLSKNISQYLGPNLQQLSLTLPQPLGLDTIKTWKDKKMILQNLKHLRILHLTLANFLTETVNYEKELISVSEHIGQNLLNLQYLSLDFYFLKVPALTDESILKISSNIFPHLNQLKGFKLICQDNAIITNEGIISFMEKMCQHTTLLEDLTLSFQKVSNLTSEIMDTIICYFDESLHSLKHFALDFLQTDIDCIGIKYLSPEACASMESLNLYTSQPLLAISPDLTNLKVLTLYIDNCENMTDQIFEGLVQSILSIPFKQLEELSLSFLKARLITDNALQVLGSEKWPHLNKLKAFRLEFSQSKQIGEIALGLTTMFMQENLMNLQSLTLIFQDGGLVGKLGIKFMMTNMVKHLKYLQYLCLDFYDSVLYRYDHVEELLEEIIDKISKNIRSLKSLKLRFGCYKIVDPAQPIALRLKQLSFIPIVSIK